MSYIEHQILEDDIASVKAGKRDPNLLNEAGQSLLTRVFMAHSDFSFETIKSAMCMLIQKGAYTVDGDTPLKALTNLPMRSSVIKLYSALLEEKSQFIMKGGEYENPLLVMAALSPMYLMAAIDTVAMNDGFRQWASTPEEKGETVSHTIWREHSEVVRAALQKGNNDHLNSKWKGACNATWALQHTLVALGGDMQYANLEGISPMDLCIGRLESGDVIFHENYGIENVVHTEWQARKIAGATLSASAQSPKTRL